MRPPWLEVMREHNDTDGHSRDEVAALLALVEALGAALDDAQAIMGSEELAGAETIARVHGMRYTEAFQARCRLAHAARTAALARYHAGPEAR